MFNKKENKEKEVQSQEKEPNDQQRSAGYKNQEDVLDAKFWYKDQYKRTVITSGIMSIALIVSIILNIILFVSEPIPRYFMQDAKGQLVEMTPLSEPYISKEGVINWTVEVVTRTLGFSFLDWRESFMSVQDQFTQAAFDQFFGSLQEQGFIDKIVEERLNMSSVVTAAPVISAQGMFNGVYSWRIEFPLTMSFESSRGRINSQNFNVTALVQRENTLINPKGVVIKQLLLDRGR